MHVPIMGSSQPGGGCRRENHNVNLREKTINVPLTHDTGVFICFPCSYHIVLHVLLCVRGVYIATGY